mmetsp:Transcript_31658/g.48423  ORF Transcript_31658/g.48423 Transcript_31658/m.48423 type:complete len:140 (-) Transcript_31658:767-1186(-)
MFSGDRVENVANIALSSGVKKDGQDLFFICDLINKTDILFRLSQFQKVVRRATLVMDGKSLEVVLDHPELIYQLLQTAVQSEAFCLCRCTPIQKCEVVRLLKAFTKDRKVIAAVGDGGNDIGMLREAHVGIGIAKKEET